MNLLILCMALAILISALLANGLKNAKDGEFEYVKDDNTIRIFRLVMPLSVIAGILVGVFEPWHWGFGAIPVDFGWAQWQQVTQNQTMAESALGTRWELWAAVLFAAGLSLRWIAILSLKRAFTVKVTILKDHQLKSDGVYTWVRHPSYTGTLSDGQYRQIFAQASGRFGRTDDYAVQTLQALRQQGIEDRALARLVALAQA